MILTKAGIPLAVAALVILVLVLWKVPQWQVGRVSRLSSKERFDRVNEARKTLATILGGVLLLLGFFGTWQNIRVAQESAATSQKALQVSQEGQITDRFSKAIEQLGATDANGEPKLEVRLGGIYALERIANDSERDHWPIMEVLCTYVRQNAPRKQESPTGKEQKPRKQTDGKQASAPSPHPRADIQAILTVLGRRNRKYETKDEHLNLHYTDLRGAFIEGDLSRAGLSGADLRGAFIFGDLSGAYLSKANLSEALFGEGNLNGAYLGETDLRGAYLGDVNLTRAILFEADLRGVSLGGAHGLTQQQLDEAKGDANTELPAGLHMPDSWEK